MLDRGLSTVSTDSRRECGSIMNTTLFSSAPTLPAKSRTSTQNDQLPGLSSDDAHTRLKKFGAKAVPDTSLRPLRLALEKFWAPVPRMLEAAIVLELMLGKYVEAAIIAGLLAFNAALGLFQETRAQATLAALKSRLGLNASVRRDGAWKTVPAAELVPGDLVKLSLGGVVAADVHITAGEVLLDQSMLTGELVPSGVRHAKLCRSARASWGNDGGSHRDEPAHQIRTDSGTRSHSPCRQFAAESGSRRGSQSRAFQWRRDRIPGCLFLLSQDAVRRDCPSCFDRGPCMDPCRAAGHVYARVGFGRASAGEGGRSSNPPLDRR